MSCSRGTVFTILLIILSASIIIRCNADGDEPPQPPKSPMDGMNPFAQMQGLMPSLQNAPEMMTSAISSMNIGNSMSSMVDQLGKVTRELSSVWGQMRESFSPQESGTRSNA